MDFIGLRRLLPLDDDDEDNIHQLLLPQAKRARPEEAMQLHCDRVVRCPGRKDRHSKVSTARGARDRRLRLSPATAIQFYDVQDRLGYDRPSKAIDWLMKEARAAIDALKDELPAEESPTPLPPTTAPSSSTSRASHFPADSTMLYQDGYHEASDLFDFFSCNAAEDYSQLLVPPPVCFPATFSHREPLQSSYSKNSAFSSLSSQIPEISFSMDELAELISTADAN